MFVSSSFLEINYGIDNKIAEFFVDREPPADNLYWKGKLLYLRPAPGYLFIPLIVDLLFRLGIGRDQLLSEAFVATMEQIGHFSALEEANQITEDEAVKRSIELVKENCSNKSFYLNLVDCFLNKKESFFYSLASSFNALRRGDLFLFSVCVLSFPQELNEKIAGQWFALINVLLLMDDSEDIEVDRQTGDKNAFLESGLDTEGVLKIKKLAAESISKINMLNPAMSLQLKNQFKEHVENAAFFKALANT